VPLGSLVTRSRFARRRESGWSQLTAEPSNSSPSLTKPLLPTSQRSPPGSRESLGWTQVPKDGTGTTVSLDGPEVDLGLTARSKRYCAGLLFFVLSAAVQVNDPSEEKGNKTLPNVTTSTMTRRLPPTIRLESVRTILYTRYPTGLGPPSVRRQNCIHSRNTTRTRNHVYGAAPRFQSSG
jgi:hypothetical protein